MPVNHGAAIPQAMIIGLDTATEWVHVALVGGASAWTRISLTSPASTASAVLLPLLDELLKEAGTSRTDVKGVVACTGPGGFTSLRVGIATAEGLAMAGTPSWGFSAFELRARALAGHGPRGTVFLVLDGRRGEAFYQPWDIKTSQAVGPAGKTPLQGLASVIGGQDWWAPERFRQIASHHLESPPVALCNEGGATVDALVGLCRLCPSRPSENPLLPYYLRETDAEINFPGSSGHLGEAHRLGHAR